LTGAPAGPFFSIPQVRQSGCGAGGTIPRVLEVNPMKMRTRKPSWFVSGLLLFAVASAGLEVVLAQPKNETRKPAFAPGEATFERLGQNKIVNTKNIAYAIDLDEAFYIYFACSSERGEDPLKLTDAKDITHAKSYFNDEKRYAQQFVKVNRYWISARNIAYFEFKDDSVIVRFNARISDAFVELTLTDADAESFRKMMRE
jgi:hypothetical protein